MRARLLSLILAIAISAYGSQAWADATDGNVSTATNWCYNTLFQANQTATKQLFVEPLVKCFTDTSQGIIPSVTTAFLIGAQTDYLPIVAIMFVIAIGYYGLRLMIGDVQRVKGDTIVLGLKLAAIIYFMNNANAIYIYLLNIMQQFSGIVAGAATSLHANGFCNDTVTVPTNTELGDTSSWADNLWLRWDCIFGYLLGIGQGSLAVYGIASFLFLMFNTMSIGILIAAVGLYLIITLLTAAFRFVHVYFMAMLSLSFLFCIGYMFVPLMLFRNTLEYFRKWLNLVLGFVLTPVMMFGFMGIMLVAMDVALFTSQYSVWSEIGGTNYGGPTANAGTGSNLFSDMTSNSFAKTDEGNPNPALQDAMKSIFTSATDGPFSEVTSGGLTNTNINCANSGGNFFAGFLGFSTCNIGQNGSTTTASSAPATAPVGFDQTALNLNYIASTFITPAKTCTTSTMGTGANPVTYYSDCPYVEDVLISICVAALLAYIMFALVSYIPTLASNLGQSILSRDIITSGREFLSSTKNAFGEGSGQTSMEVGKTTAQGATQGAAAQQGGSAAARAGQAGAAPRSGGASFMRTISAMLAGDR